MLTAGEREKTAAMTRVWFVFCVKTIWVQHCILLVQASRSMASRTYSDYETVKEAMTGACVCACVCLFVCLFVYLFVCLRF